MMEQSKVTDKNGEDWVKSSVRNKRLQVRRALVGILETRLLRELSKGGDILLRR